MKIAIFHFGPLEYFPPVMNFIDYLAANLPPGAKLRVYTTASDRHEIYFSSHNNNVTIKRLGRYSWLKKPAKRYVLYTAYYMSSFIDCLAWNASRVIYYESFSALPVYWLSRIKKKIKIFIHYHEYVSPAEYGQIRLLNIIHRLERKMYEQVAWISQTNTKRMELFLRDIGLPGLSNTRVIPNFPPLKWKTETRGKIIQTPVNVVYVGTWSFETMYFKEFINWVEAQEGALKWDIYSQQDTTALAAYLKAVNSKFIAIKGMINYDHLPELLGAYDAGVILHKAETDNYKYNAPNKLFEYLACGLDVWMPDTLEGAADYITEGTYPQVLPLAFGKLGIYNVTTLVNREGKMYKPSTYFCAEVYALLLPELFS